MCSPQLSRLLHSVADLAASEGSLPEGEERNPNEAAEARMRYLQATKWQRSGVIPEIPPEGVVPTYAAPQEQGKYASLLG